MENNEQYLEILLARISGLEQKIKDLEDRIDYLEMQRTPLRGVLSAPIVGPHYQPVIGQTRQVEVTPVS